ncbi:MAG: hypothetical protein R3245_05615, partial [Kiloniellales bacterium]|nr:hypothetical protein [Kiloniellales bacterium]
AIAAEDVRLRAGLHNGFIRLVFDWPRDVPYSVKLEASNLIVTFQTPLSLNAKPAVDLLGGKIEEPKVSDDGLKVTIGLADNYEILDFTLTNRVVIDLYPETVKQNAENSQPSEGREGGEEKVKGLASAGRSALSVGNLANGSAKDGTKPRERTADRLNTPFVFPKGRSAEEVPLDKQKEEEIAGDASAMPHAEERGEGRMATAELSHRPTDKAPVTLYLPGKTAQVADLEKKDNSSGLSSVAETRSAASPTEEPLSNSAPESQFAPFPGSGSGSVSTPQQVEVSSAEGRVEILPAGINLDREAMPLGQIPEAGMPIRLRFSWGERPAAAAFRYGNEIWLVFDEPLESDAKHLIEKAELDFSRVRQIDSEHGSALVFAIPAPQIAVRLRQEPDGWLADFRPRSNLPLAELQVEVVDLSDSRVLRYSHDKVGEIHWLADEDRRERLVVVPFDQEGVGTAISSAYPQFQTLRSQQGLVLRPTSDGVEVAVTPNGVLVRHKDGLLVSSKETRDLLPVDRAKLGFGRRLFRLGRWRQGDQENFAETKQRLMREVISQEGDDRLIAHLSLARFYFAWGLATETLGLLNVIENEAPEITDDPEFRLMRAASAFIIEDFETAGRLLADPVLAGEREALLWQSAYSAVVQDWQAAANGYAAVDDLIASYPPRVRNSLLLWGAEARLGVGDTGGTSEYLVALSRFDMNKAEAAQAKYLTAKRFYMDGEVDLAVSLWRELEKDPHQSSRARARLGLLEAAVESGEIEVEDAIEALERLRYSWRGDDFERATLLRLATLYEEDRRFRDSLLTLERIATQFPEFDQAGQITGRMRELFVKIFNDKEGQPITPVEAFTIYNQFKELTPAGEEGERIVSRLADRLIEIDLLEKASELLNEQRRYRLSGEPRYRMGAKLALVHIMNRDGDAALAVLNDEQDAGFGNEELDLERDRLRARALALNGDYREALDAIEGDESGEATLLRAEYFWKLEDWRAAAMALERLVPIPPDSVELSEAEADRVMSLAIALTMADERA